MSPSCRLISARKFSKTSTSVYISTKASRTILKRSSVSAAVVPKESWIMAKKKAAKKKPAAAKKATKKVTKKAVKKAAKKVVKKAKGPREGIDQIPPMQKTTKKKR